MVKLGSLYRGGSHRYPSESTTLDRLEFNQRIQERRLMQEEQRQWERMSPNQTELQVAKMSQYHTERFVTKLNINRRKFNNSTSQIKHFRRNLARSKIFNATRKTLKELYSDFAQSFKMKTHHQWWLKQLDDNSTHQRWNFHGSTNCWLKTQRQRRCISRLLVTFNVFGYNQRLVINLQIIFDHGRSVVD